MKTTKELTEKQIERITVKANKAIHKKFPLLDSSVKGFTIPYIIEEYEKVVKRGV